MNNIQAPNPRPVYVANETVRPSVPKEDIHCADEKHQQVVSQVKVIQELYSDKADRILEEARKEQISDYEADGKSRLERIQQGTILDIKI